MLRRLDPAELAPYDKDLPDPGDVVQAVRQIAAALFEAGPQIDAEGVIGPDIFGLMADSGLLLAPFPRHLGGQDLLETERASDLAAVLRQVGSGDLSVARLYEGHVNAVGLVARYGTDAQLSALADHVRDGALSAVWNADGRFALQARQESGDWLCEGEKILASGAGQISRPLVTATTEGGRIMLLPDLEPRARADLSAWHPRGMRASATGTVTLTGCRVDAAWQVGAPGDYMRQPVFSGGAWRFCAVHLGAAERLLDLFRAHLNSTRRAEDPYQKQRIALATVAVTTASLWIEKAASMVARQQGSAERIVAFVNFTRMVTERACLDVLELVHRGVGLQSFMQASPVERISRDLSTYLRQPVPDAAMADAAAVVLASEQPVIDFWTL